MFRKIAVGGMGVLLCATPFVVLAQTDDTPPNGDNSTVYCPALVQTIQKGARDATTVPPGQVTELQHFLSDYYDIDPEDIQPVPEPR